MFSHSYWSPFLEPFCRLFAICRHMGNPLELRLRLQRDFFVDFSTDLIVVRAITTMLCAAPTTRSGHAR